MRWYSGRCFKKAYFTKQQWKHFFAFTGLTTKSYMTWCGNCEGRRRDIFKKITSVLDLKLQRIAAAYEDLQAEMWDRGFQKELRNTGKLSNRAIWWREKNLCKSCESSVTASAASAVEINLAKFRTSTTMLLRTAQCERRKHVFLLHNISRWKHRHCISKNVIKGTLCYIISPLDVVVLLCMHTTTNGLPAGPPKMWCNHRCFVDVKRQSP